jgi:hypothetical protein
MTVVTRQTTATRALIALAVAATAPALLLATGSRLVMRGLPARLDPARHDPWAWPRTVLNIELKLLLVVAPVALVWWALDRRGERRKRVAAGVGAAAGAAAAIMQNAPPDARALSHDMLWVLALAAVAGALIGAVMSLIARAIAYRRLPEAADVAEVF